MSKCDLRIELEGGPEANFEAGGEVRGRLFVEVNAECKCDALTLQRYWRTHGRGNRTSGGEETLTLHQGLLLPGESYEFAFAYAIPRGPVTYHGDYLNVDWYLEARVDVPWAIDPKTEVEFLVVPGPQGTDAPSIPDAALQLGHGISAVIGGCFGGIFALAGIGMLIGFGITLASDSFEFEMIMLGFMGLIFTLVGCGIAFMGVRSYLAERKLGPVTMSCTPSEAHAGDEVTLSLAFTPQSRVNLNGIQANLTCKEVVVSGSGTNRSTHTNTVHDEEREVDGAHAIYPGDAQEHTVSFRLPDDAPLSFSASDNNLRWGLEVHIDIAGWPDWVRTQPLVVSAPAQKA